MNPTPDVCLENKKKQRKTNQRNRKPLITSREIDTVLSFIDTRNDVGGLSQRGLIDAAVAAGVRRFAPSEWSV
jgi:hypothetical protein